MYVEKFKTQMDADISIQIQRKNNKLTFAYKCSRSVHEYGMARHGMAVFNGTAVIIASVYN